MDIGILSNIVPDEGGTILFNQDFTLPGFGNAHLLVQSITGMDGAGIRNPITNRPHKDGAIIHAFKREARIFTIEGLILAEDVDTRWAVADFIRGVTDNMVENEGRYNFSPANQAQDDRYLDVRLYEAPDLSQMNQGNAGPKNFSMTFIAGDPRAYTDEPGVTIQAPGTAVLIENNGNTPAYIIFTVHANGETIQNFRLQNQDTLFELNWLDDGLPVGLDTTRTGTIDMLEETMFQGDSRNLIGGVVLASSDFFPIAPGGNIIGFDGDIGSAYVEVEVRSAWV